MRISNNSKNWLDTVYESISLDFGLLTILGCLLLHLSGFVEL